MTIYMGRLGGTTDQGAPEGTGGSGGAAISITSRLNRYLWNSHNERQGLVLETAHKALDETVVGVLEAGFSWLPQMSTFQERSQP